MQQRAIRSEAKAMLVEGGALHSDVVDLFLSKNAKTIKIDEETGETLGMADAFTAFKTSHASLFKAAPLAPDPNAPTEEKTGKTLEKDDTGYFLLDDKGKRVDYVLDDKTKKYVEKKPNHTGPGPSPAGGPGSSTPGVLPDLRNMTPAERKAALTDYRKSLRK